MSINEQKSFSVYAEIIEEALPRIL